MKTDRLIFYSCLLMSTTGLCAGAPPVTRFASTEWPPYSSQALPEEGLFSAIVSAVLKQEGHQASFDYFPWKRTVSAGALDPAYVGYMPTWRSAERDKSCYFSLPVSSSSTVFAYLRDDPLAVNTLADLKGVHVGVVAGYVYGEDLDALLQRDVLRPDEGLSDEINIRKLLAGRIRVVVIEQRVLRHLLATATFSAADRARVVVAEHLVRDRSVYICFKRTPEGAVQRRQFDDAAKTLDLPKIERNYLRRIGE